VIYSLWIVFTHVYRRFEVAPRLALTSKKPFSGKSVARKIAKHLQFRPNEEALGTVAALRDFLDQGPGTLSLDELDLADPDMWRALLRIWNLGYERGVKISLKVGKERHLVDIHAPILGTGLGTFLGHSQQTRTYCLEMTRYSEKAKPERR